MMGKRRRALRAAAAAASAAAPPLSEKADGVPADATVPTAPATAAAAPDGLLAADGATDPAAVAAKRPPQPSYAKLRMARLPPSVTAGAAANAARSAATAAVSARERTTQPRYAILRMAPPPPVVETGMATAADALAEETAATVVAVAVPDGAGSAATPSVQVPTVVPIAETAATDDDDEHHDAKTAAEAAAAATSAEVGADPGSKEAGAEVQACEEPLSVEEVAAAGAVATQSVR